MYSKLNGKFACAGFTCTFHANTTIFFPPKIFRNTSLDVNAADHICDSVLYSRCVWAIIVRYFFACGSQLLFLVSHGSTNCWIWLNFGD